MSEKEMNKRKRYKKHREKWIFVQVVAITVITLAMLISGIVSYNLNKTYYIGYTESGNIDYNVFLKDNDFYEESYIGKDQSYVASIIDKIIADYSYSIDMDVDDVNYRYSYTVKSRLEIIDNTSERPLFNPEYELVSVQNKLQNTSNRLLINEIIVINYDEYNNIANSFIETYGLSNVTSNIVVTLEVDVLSDCNAFSGSSADSYSSELRIPLTTKTVNIKMSSMVPDAESKMMACTRGAGSEVFKTTAIVLAVVDALVILVLLAFIYLTRTDDITYSARVKKILSQHKSYIQKINNLFDTSNYQIVLVDRFDEMLEIRDTIQAPILMYENPEKTCAQFIIPTDSKLLYKYVIKIDGYEEPESPKAPDPAPTTIVKPNITNVVRPVVKVVVAPPAAPEKKESEATVETVMEEPEIEIETEAEEIPCVTATVEEDTESLENEDYQEVEDILALIPETDEETHTVDAIDVMWKEREDRTYRYDPDGNEVEEGDVVLVPTRDAESDKEVVREAEVSKGNYKVDPAALDYPLKKIIGVVKRKAEKAFIAMITPDDEEKN